MLRSRIIPILLVRNNGLVKTLNFSNDAPFLYGALAIILAITLGALAALARKILSPIAKKMLSDFRKKDVKKNEEVKFPEK